MLYPKKSMHQYYYLPCDHIKEKSYLDTNHRIKKLMRTRTRDPFISKFRLMTYSDILDYLDIFSYYLK